jgi:16S rRNA (guanine966-N2)-methyltransferase
MRIIAGRLKGRRLEGPVSPGVRPTSDPLRETLFNVLGPSLDEARVLDGYAGTGALGLEAYSRGAAHVTFVERDRRMIAVLTRNVGACGAADACVIIRGDFTASDARVTPASFDLVLLDPPYDVGSFDRLMAGAAAAVASDGRVVLEHSRRVASPESAGALHRYRHLVAGDSALSFYAPVAPA